MKIIHWPARTGDPINPDHYKLLSPEPWDVISAWNLDYWRASALEYIARAGRKDSAELDIRKAINYLNRYLQELTKE